MVKPPAPGASLQFVTKMKEMTVLEAQNDCHQIRNPQHQGELWCFRPASQNLSSSTIMYLMMLSFPKVAATLTSKVASMAIDLKPGNKTDATISEPINILLISKFTGK